MSSTTELFQQIKAHMNDFEANHVDASNGNKAAGRRTRKAIGEIKKLATPYKQASVKELS